MKNITKEYVVGDTVLKALNNVSVDIDKGEFVAIVGQSGSGKSTLMNILGCLDIPEKGEYYLNGNNILKSGEGKLSEIKKSVLFFKALIWLILFRHLKMLNFLFYTEALKKVSGES